MNWHTLGPEVSLFSFQYMESVGVLWADSANLTKTQLWSTTLPREMDPLDPTYETWAIFALFFIHPDAAKCRKLRHLHILCPMFTRGVFREGARCGREVATRVTSRISAQREKSPGTFIQYLHMFSVLKIWRHG